MLFCSILLRSVGNIQSCVTNNPFHSWLVRVRNTIYCFQIKIKTNKQTSTKPTTAQAGVTVWYRENWGGFLICVIQKVRLDHYRSPTVLQFWFELRSKIYAALRLNCSLERDLQMFLIVVETVAIEIGLWSIMQRTRFLAFGKTDGGHFPPILLCQFCPLVLCWFLNNISFYVRDFWWFSFPWCLCFICVNCLSCRCLATTPAKRFLGRNTWHGTMSPFNWSSWVRFRALI